MSYLRKLGFVLGKCLPGQRAVFAAAFVVAVVAAAIYAQEAAVPASQPAAAVPHANETPPQTASAPDEPSAVKMVQPGAFDIHARDTDLRIILQLLGTQGRRNIVTTKEVSGKVSADLYGVTFKEALDAVLRSAGYVYEEKGNFVYVYTPDQLDKIEKSERKMVVQTFRLNYITAADAHKLLAPALSPDGSVAETQAAAVGITPSNTDSGGNTYATEDVLVVRDYEEQMRNIAKIIHDIDVRPEQVLIEATILQATLNENNALGIDFNVLAGVDFEGINASSTSGMENLTPGALTAQQIQNNATAGSVRTDFAGTVPQGGLSIGMIADKVAFFVRALETVTPTTVLANPKLLVVNKQRGEVMVGNHDGYLTTTVTETVATQTVQFLDTGTRLIVRPYIGRNGYIRLELHPEDSSGQVTLVGSSALPNSSTTEVTSNVLVRDGHTIVIGGLFRELTQSSRSQVPIAGNIPIVGALFRSTADTTTRAEVIILITPHIIKQTEDEAVGEQLKDDVERFRVGARNGLTWWGHDRLAQSYLRYARKDLANGQTSKAMWNLDMSLSLSPQGPEAIELKERLTGKAYWSTETRVSDAKYILQQMIMQELGLPLDPIIPPQKPLDVNNIPDAAREAFGIEPQSLEAMPELAVHGRLRVPPASAPADAEEVKTTTTAPATEPVEQ